MKIVEFILSATLGALLTLLIIQQRSRAIIIVPQNPDTLKIVEPVIDTIYKTTFLKESKVVKDTLKMVIENVDTVYRYVYKDETKLYKLNSRLMLTRNKLPVFEYRVDVKMPPDRFISPRMVYFNGNIGLGIEYSTKNYKVGLDFFNNKTMGGHFGYTHNRFTSGIRLYPGQTYVYAGIKL